MTDPTPYLYFIVIVTVPDGATAYYGPAAKGKAEDAAYSMRSIYPHSIVTVAPLESLGELGP